MISTVAAQQIRSLFRQRVFVAFLAAFLAMTALAGVLGWSSHQTILRVYDVATGILQGQGQAAPPNPFLLKPPLSLVENLVVYVPLLGALMALILGHISISDDESNGIARLIFSRPVSRTRYLVAKIAAACVVTGASLVLGFIVTVGSLVLINQHMPTVDSVWRLAQFFGLSWLYLIGFVLIGMTTSLIVHRRSLALLAAISAWLVITFAVPQFTSGLRPISSLNPILDPVSTTQRFFHITALGRPLSVSEQYKEASGRILATAGTEPGWSTVQRILPMLIMIAVLTLAAFLLIQHRDFTRAANNA
jgi:ABC-type transport system involved in multi-copper enzyme maturation permease subunit